MGTEDPQLLIQEYQLHQHAKNKIHSHQEKTEGAAGFLEIRDRFIAKRIDETHEDGETGLLFLGAAHRLGMQIFGDIHFDTLGAIRPWERQFPIARIAPDISRAARRFRGRGRVGVLPRRCVRMK